MKQTQFTSLVESQFPLNNDLEGARARAFILTMTHRAGWEIANNPGLDTALQELKIDDLPAYRHVASFRRSALDSPLGINPTQEELRLIQQDDI
jgi:hypothetical protein